MSRRDEKRLLTERMGSVPSYMQWSAEEVGEIFKSFVNIFKSVGSSIKLLKDTLVLNMRVVAASITQDRGKIAKAYEEFGKARDEYRKDTEEHLKYFKKAYSDPTLDNVWGVGPRVLAFASNPLLFLAFQKANKSAGGSQLFKSDNEDNEDNEDKDTQPEKPEKGAKASPQLDYALRFFGYDASAPLSEAVGTPAAAPAPAPTAPAQSTKQPAFTPEQMKRAEELKKIAERSIPLEIENIKKVSDILKNKVLTIKMVVDAKDFDSLDKSLEALAASGVKTLSAGIKTARKKIEEDLSKQQKEDPKKFAADAERMRKTAPELAGEDDVQVMIKAAFGAAKSQIQNQLTTSYQQIVNDSNKALQLPIDTRTREMLQDSQLGKQYLTAIDNFQRQIQAEDVSVKNLGK